MRHLLLVIYCSFLTLYAYSQTVNDEYAFFDYTYDKSLIRKNQVETVTIQTSYGDGINWGKSIFHFNKEGFLTKQLILDSTGTLLRTFHFKINAQTDLIAIIQEDLEIKRTDTTLYYKQYKNGLLFQDSCSTTPMRYNYEYNRNGILQKKITTAFGGTQNEKKRITLFQLDTLNRPIHVVDSLFTQNNKEVVIISDRDYVYNKNGKVENIIEKIDGAHFEIINDGSWKYSYDSKGNLIQSTRNNDAFYFFTYDEKGLIIQCKTILQLDEFEKMGRIETFSYTYWK